MLWKRGTSIPKRVSGLYKACANDFPPPPAKVPATPDPLPASSETPSLHTPNPPVIGYAGGGTAIAAIAATRDEKRKP
ncbi:hypothetical protein Q3G72_010510 [Acer saccharum]|nr:hypothetical protein Q3G72_019402 [Acer saccharum]KAK1565296.1 hypothetical protein Q3G72_023547 [Acer saccharum]KAK1581950.1 hypothetical protein Q3G72_010510 [Acer saccharum]